MAELIDATDCLLYINTLKHLSVRFLQVIAF